MPSKLDLIDERFNLDKEKALWEKYSNEVVYKISQKVLIDPALNGVCSGFVLDWARRKYAMTKNKQPKGSYAVSNRGVAKSDGMLDYDEFNRMQKKVEKRILPLHEAKKQAIDKLKPLNQATQENIIKETTGKSPKFTKPLTSLFAGTGPDFKLDWLQGDTGPLALLFARLC